MRGSKRVGRARLRRGDARDALEAAERGLIVDELNEALWRLALEAEGALGLREAIEERCGRLREILGERLALEPTKETRALYLRLLNQAERLGTRSSDPPAVGARPVSCGCVRRRASVPVGDSSRLDD